MPLYRKYVVLGIAALAVAAFASSWLVADDSAWAALAPKASFLCIVAALLLGLLPEPTQAAVPAPRTLSSDVLNDTSLTLSLTERIANAIELSREHSRSFGVVSIRTHEAGKLSRAAGGDRFDLAMARVAEALRAGLRTTDRPLVGERGEILICVPLIAVRGDLEGIAARMSQRASALLASELGVPAPVTDTGIAMYPVGGYRSDELIATARDGANAACAARLGRSMPRRRNTAPVPVLPPRRMARPQRA